MKFLSTGSIVYGALPRGCELCQRGLKSIIFVTGFCPRKCFYCPLSTARREKDIFLVNEKRVRKISEIVSEIALSGSLGAGITGGDPLVRAKRTLDIITRIKDVFGDIFHVHLYTTGKNLTQSISLSLRSAGLDELRIHCEFKDLVTIERITKSLKGLDIGLEIPVFPGEIEKALKFIKCAERIGFNFVNLNELEFSESNYLGLLSRGYELDKDYRAARGSRDTALKILERVEREGLDISVHFCPVRVKDFFQTGLRLYRKAIITGKSYETITDDGTFLILVTTQRPDIPFKLYSYSLIGEYLTSIWLKEKVKGWKKIREISGSIRRIILEEEIIE